MAYANLVGVSCANRAEVFKRFRDFVCKRNGSYDYSATGIGWTLHDAVYGTDENTIATNDYFVIKSVGESGNEALYFKCSYISDYIVIRGYQYWDNSTHIGTQAYNSASNWNILNTAVPVLWVYGDLDSIMAVSRETSVSANFYPVTFGKSYIQHLGEDIVTTTGVLTSGADKVIDVGAVPTGWEVGQKVYIRDNAQIERITISAKTASTITATLVNGYASGAKVSAYVGYYCVTSNQFSSGLSWLIDGAGNKSTTVGAWVTNATLASYGYPEALTGKHLFPPYFAGTQVNGYMGQLRNVLGRHTSGVTALDVHDVSGVNYRAFTLYSSAYVMIKEV